MYRHYETGAFAIHYDPLSHDLVVSSKVSDEVLRMNLLEMQTRLGSLEAAQNESAKMIEEFTYKLLLKHKHEIGFHEDNVNEEKSPPTPRLNL